MILIENVEVGIAGEIHPQTLSQAHLEHPLFFAELNLDDLQHHVKTKIKMEPLPHYPASSRDWTLTLQEDIRVGDILAYIKKEGSRLLESVSLLPDIYRSDKLGSNLKNVTFRFVYRDQEKTISFTDVENEHLRITNTITEYLRK